MSGGANAITWRGLDESRGTAAMWLVIATESFLFADLFFAYIFLGRSGWKYPDEPPPELTMPFAMLAVLLCSSALLFWGERQLKARHYGKAKGALAGTVAFGLLFLFLQVREYLGHLRTLTPRTSTYGSIFYTVTSFHAAHLVAGLLILSYVLLLPRLEPAAAPPHRPYHNASMYWHFVDAVWIVIVALLYVAPHTR